MSYANSVQMLRKYSDLIKENSELTASDDFSHTENYSISSSNNIAFVKWIADKMQQMGWTKEDAKNRYEEAKAGNDVWIHEFGTEVEGTVGHKINTAFTSNNVAIQKGAGWLAGLLTVTKKTEPVKNWEDPDAEWDDPERRDERSKEDFDKWNTGYGSHYW